MNPKTSSNFGQCCKSGWWKMGLLIWKNLTLRKRHWIVTVFEIILPTVSAVLIAYIWGYYISTLYPRWSGNGGGHPGGHDPGRSDPGGSDPGGSDPGGSDPGGYDYDPGGSDPGGHGGRSYEYKCTRSFYSLFKGNYNVYVISSLLPIMLTLGFIFIVPSVLRGIVHERSSGIKEFMKLCGIPNWMHLIGWTFNSMIILTISITIVILFLCVPIFNPSQPQATVVYNGDFTVWWVTMFLYVLSTTTFCFLISSFFQKPMIAIIAGLIIFLATYFVPESKIESGLGDHNDGGYYKEMSLTEKYLFGLLPNVAFYFALKVLAAFELFVPGVDGSCVKIANPSFKRNPFAYNKDGIFSATGTGMHWNNLYEKMNDDDSLTLGHCFNMLLIDTVLYYLLALYFEAVLPSQYGVRKPFYFLFLPWTWGLNCFTRRSAQVQPGVAYEAKNDPESSVAQGGNNDAQGTNTFEGAEGSSSGPPESAQFTPQIEMSNSIGTEGTPGIIGSGVEVTNPIEPAPHGLKVGVEIKNLRKTFNFGKKVAVDNLSMKMYEGEIFALLGHNGAGKTTAISCCVGETAPTQGTAIISGYDVRTRLADVRRNLGFCPQHNLIFNDLTVEEHLIFFGMLKGISSAEAKEERREMLIKIELTDEADVLGEFLSGGEKRKLSLGIALIGDAKVVFLDEPTTGMDVEARRAIWDILLYERGHRTIVLTTHFMEEADALGDRIGIMANGKLVCYGTTTFLKNFYGAGYNLNFTMSTDDTRKQICKTVQSHVPNAYPNLRETYKPLRMSIILPKQTTLTSMFPALFKALESKKDSFGIVTMSLSMTTMDEVFVMAGESVHVAKDAPLVIANDVETPSIPPDSAKAPVSPQANVYPQQTLSKGNVAGETDQPDKTGKLTGNLKDGDLNDPTQAPQTLESELITGQEPYAIEQDQQQLFQKPKTKGVELILSQFFGLFIKRVRHALRNCSLIIPQVGVPILLVIAGILSTQSIFPESQYETHWKRSAVDGPHGRSFGNSLMIKRLARPLARTQVDSLTIIFFSLAFAILVPMGLIILTASFVAFPTEERLCKGKQLQIMTGVNPALYWLASFMWDYFVTFITVLLMLVCFLVFQNNGAYTYGAGVKGFLALFLLFMAFGYAAIPFSYMISLCCGSVSGGFSCVVTIHLLTGILLPTFALIFEQWNYNIAVSLKSQSVTWVSTLILTVCRVFPAFGLATSASRFTMVAAENFNYGGPPPTSLFVGSFFSWSTILNNDPYYYIFPFVTSGMLQELVFLILYGTGYILFLLMWETGVLRKTSAKALQNEPEQFVGSSDEDVLAESQRIQQLLNEGRPQVDAMVVSTLCKSYGEFVAVSELSFGVHYGECFGLLGVNGAGKTTTFRMITGDETRSSGTVYAMCNNIDKNKQAYLSSLGYCPQFDGIIGVLSGRQMIALFARLRGVKKVQQETNEWLARVGLTEAADLRCEGYSGGMKRRLSTAMAMIGDPLVVLLDEPTSGVDPVSRREFWKIINEINESGRSIILTSHSMDEITACCARLGIMVNGMLQCLGSVDYLRNKFAQGYTLFIRLKPEADIESEEMLALHEALTVKLEPCELKEKHATAMEYQILNAHFSWSVLYESMEALKAEYPELIEDYRFTETTLEEVFLNFARTQEELSDIPKPRCCACFRR